MVQADQTYFRRNFKGSKPVGRRQRKRGTRNGLRRPSLMSQLPGRLKALIARFRGMAPKYLHRYLTLHIMDERVQRLTAAKARAVLAA